jgi:hypothetical protein
MYVGLVRFCVASGGHNLNLVEYTIKPDKCQVIGFVLCLNLVCDGSEIVPVGSLSFLSVNLSL